MIACNDNIIIRLDPEESTTVSGLLIKPGSACEHVLRTAEVIGVGPGCWAKKANVRIPTGLSVGDGVVFIKFVATHTGNAQGIQHVLGNELSIIKPSDVLLVYDRSNPPEFNQ